MTTTPSTQRLNVHIRPQPPVLDSIQLQDIQLPLPTGPDAWHRPGKPQPCRVSLKLSYSSATAAAAADDVSLSLDYGKLYRRLEGDIRSGHSHAHGHGNSNSSSSRSGGDTGSGEDVRVTAGIVAGCGLGLLDETAAGVRRMSHSQGEHETAATAAQAPIDASYGQCEVWLHLPKAILRADDGLTYRSLTVWGYRQDDEGYGERCPVVLEEEFRVDGIRCYCILGVNSHERVEKQAVVVSLQFRGPGQLAWGSAVVDTYQEMTRVVAEVFFFRFLPFFFLLARLIRAAGRRYCLPDGGGPGHLYCSRGHGGLCQ